MVKRKKVRNLPSKKSLKTTFALFGSPKKNFFRISTFEIGDNLKYFEDMPAISESVHRHCAAAIVTVFLLCQLRSLRSTDKPAQLDALPSFKYYKRILLAGAPGRILAFALSVSQPEVVLCLPTEAEDMASWLRSVLDIFVGNEKKIQSVNEGNVIDYITGDMSRIIGIINSTPSNNRHILGISEDCYTYTVSECLSKIKYSKIAELDPSVVIATIHEALDMKKDDLGDIISLSFDEVPFTGKNVSNGCCQLENEIFGKHFPLRTKEKASRSFATKEAPKYLDGNVLTKHLNAAQIKKYQAAVYLKRHDIVTQLNELVESKPETAKDK